ncbi:hypothetical protein WA158_004841 [Blastocystis sp. Blastoise]
MKRVYPFINKTNLKNIGFSTLHCRCASTEAVISNSSLLPEPPKIEFMNSSNDTQCLLTKNFEYEWGQYINSKITNNLQYLIKNSKSESVLSYITEEAYKYKENDKIIKQITSFFTKLFEFSNSSDSIVTSVSSINNNNLNNNDINNNDIKNNDIKNNDINITKQIIMNEYCDILITIIKKKKPIGQLYNLLINIYTYQNHPLYADNLLPLLSFGFKNKLILQNNLISAVISALSTPYLNQSLSYFLPLLQKSISPADINVLFKSHAYDNVLSSLYNYIYLYPSLLPMNKYIYNYSTSFLFTPSIYIYIYNSTTLSGKLLLYLNDLSQYKLSTSFLSCLSLPIYTDIYYNFTEDILNIDEKSIFINSEDKNAKSKYIHIIYEYIQRMANEYDQIETKTNINMNKNISSDISSDDSNGDNNNHNISDNNNHNISDNNNNNSNNNILTVSPISSKANNYLLYKLLVTLSQGNEDEFNTIATLCMSIYDAAFVNLALAQYLKILSTITPSSLSTCLSILSHNTNTYILPTELASLSHYCQQFSNDEKLMNTISIYLSTYKDDIKRKEIYNTIYSRIYKEKNTIDAMNRENIQIKQEQDEFSKGDNDLFIDDSMKNGIDINIDKETYNNVYQCLCLYSINMNIYKNTNNNILKFMKEKNIPVSMNGYYSLLSHTYTQYIQNNRDYSQEEQLALLYPWFLNTPLSIQGSSWRNICLLLSPSTEDILPDQILEIYNNNSINHSSISSLIEYQKMIHYLYPLLLESLNMKNSIDNVTINKNQKKLTINYNNSSASDSMKICISQLYTYFCSLYHFK